MTASMLKLPHMDRLSWKLGMSFAVLVVGGQLAGFALAYQQWYGQFLATLERHTAQETALVRLALESQMLERDDRLIRKMVSSFANSTSLDRVMILDRRGEVRFSSDPGITTQHFTQADPTCQVCHRVAAEDRGRSVLLTLAGGRVLRAVQPIANAPECQGCHDPSHRINGLIIADVDLEDSLRALQHDAGVLALGTSGIGVLLLIGIGLVVRRLVLRRLRAFESTARAVAEGHLERRVVIHEKDALARVEQQFNRMADSVTGLLSEVEQQHAQLELVMNSVDDGMVVLDRDRNIVAANEAFWRRFPGASLSIGGICCRDDASTLGCGTTGRCPTLDCFATGRGQTVMHTRVRGNGSTRQDEVRASPVISAAGTITHVVEVWRDVTDRRSAEARLAEYQRLVSLGMLAAGFSHEINTPLTSISTCVDGILRLCLAPLAPEQQAQVEDYARIAATQVGRCGTITAQFLDLARGRSLPGETVDLAQGIELVTRLCKHRANEAGVKLEVSLAPGLPSVRANSAALQQVLMNLIINAVEASPKGATVRVVTPADAAPRVVVSDTGAGIAAEDRPRLFEPFFTRKDKGTGLGLFISMGLVRSWGGDITLESELGRGTTFTVTFASAAGAVVEAAGAPAAGLVARAALDAPATDRVGGT